MAVYEFEPKTPGPKVSSKPADTIIKVKSSYYDRFGQRILKDKSNIDRLAGYRRWRMDFKRRGIGGGRLFALDCDQIEYRVYDGQICVVGLLEMTRVDIDDEITFRELERRFSETGQGRFARYMADHVDTHAWIVGYQDPLNNFWLYNLTLDEGWWAMDIEAYEAWLEAACPYPPKEQKCYA